jgi:methionyl aminopeptidase
VIALRTASEIEKIRESCGIVHEALDLAGSMIAPGLMTEEIDRALDGYIRGRGGVPSFKGYRGYPASTCISVNDQVVHGIPSGRRLLEGDIVSVDVGVVKGGYHGDAARTFSVGAIAPKVERLLAVTREALELGIQAARPGKRIGDISHAVQGYVEENGLAVVRALVGHGIGRQMHEEPPVPNYGKPGTGPELKAGMVLAIEPMVNAGGWDVVTLDDGWTIVTKDQSLSAHFEHTIAVTEGGPVILTRGGDSGGAM